MMLFNDRFVEKEDLHISFEDRGYVFGDGVYEMFRIYNGKLFARDAHLQRLERSAGEIRLDLPRSLAEIGEQLEKLTALSQISEGTLYMQITRGAAPRAHAFPENSHPVMLAYCNEVRRPLKTMKAGISAVTLPDLRWHRCHIKSLNLLGNVLAKQDALDAGANEAILHRDGTVTECSASNLMIVKNGELWTHPANHLILHGVTRAVVLKLARNLGIAVHEQAFTVQDCLAADEVFITGTTVEITPVVSVDGSAIAVGRAGAVTSKLQQAFEQEIERL